MQLKKKGPPSEIGNGKEVNVFRLACLRVDLRGYLEFSSHYNPRSLSFMYENTILVPICQSDMI